MIDNQQQAEIAAAQAEIDAAQQRIFIVQHAYETAVADHSRVQALLDESIQTVATKYNELSAENLAVMQAIDAAQKRIQLATTAPTYILTADRTEVDEGQQVVISLATTGVAAGWNIPYEMSGIAAEDLTEGSLHGNFFIGTDGTAQVAVAIAADAVTEGSETLSLRLLGEGFVSIDVRLHDTSTTPPPPVPTYDLSSESTEADEGATIIVRLTTTHVPAGTVVGYSLAGVQPQDITGSLNGSFVIGTDGTASVSLSIAADKLTEGTETLTMTLAGVEHAWSLRIRDTSVTDVPPIAGTLQPNIAGEEQMPQFILDDQANGPDFANWCSFLGLAWRHRDVGDWLDADGIQQGPKPFASVGVPVAGAYYEMPIKALVERLLVNGNQGIRMKAGGVGGTLICSGRVSENPPQLLVTTPDGVISCPCTASAAWTNRTTGTSPQDSRLKWQINGESFHGALRFDLSQVIGPVSDATLRVHVQARYGSGTTMQATELQGRRFVIGCGSATPVLGLAAEVGEANLPTTPGVDMAGDFAGTTFDAKKVVFNVPKLFGRVNAHPDTFVGIVDDIHAPGTKAWRGKFVPVNLGNSTSVGTDPRRIAFDGTKQLMVADETDPMFPAINPRLSVWFRGYFLLGEDYGTIDDGTKLGLTLDLRLGWWNWAKYWQSTRGNGGARGDGLKVISSVNNGGKIQNQWDYHGHMLRMEAGQRPRNPFAYDRIRRLVGYNYHIDQKGPFPGGVDDPLGGVMYGNMLESMIRMGTPYCLEQFVQMNDVEGPFDAWGNGTAVPNGILHTELNGVVIDRRENYRWRCHPDMGIGGVNCNNYMGGRQQTFNEMHFEINNLAVGNRRFGPRVA